MATATHVITTDSVDILGDVDTTTAAPTLGQTLTWDNTNWVPQTPASGVTTLAALTDTNITAPVAGSILVWDATAGDWVDYAFVDGSGIDFTLADGSVTANLDINGLATTALDPATDFVPFFDTSGTANGKVLVQDLQDDDWREADGTGQNPTYAGNKRADGNIGIQFDPTTDLDAGAGTINAALAVGGDLAAGLGGAGATGLILEDSAGVRWRFVVATDGRMVATDLV